MMHHDDTQLIGQILNGDVSGYAILVERYKDLAYTIAFRILGKREDSEEIVQDAFVKAFRSLSSFRQHAKFSTWLYRIVYNTAISKKRLKGLNIHSIEDVRLADLCTENEDDAVEDKGKLLERAMQQLTEEERALVTLYYIDESGVDEIHNITGLSKSNVKVKLFRVRKKLQEFVRNPSLVLYS
jgi:RNA polymerase sigma-70 factor (ECF subfamily)